MSKMQRRKKSPHAPEPERLVSLNEAARIISRLRLYHKEPARSTMTQWCRRQRFPHATRFGPDGRWLIPEADLYAFRAPVMGKPRRP